MVSNGKHLVQWPSTLATSTNGDGWNSETPAPIGDRQRASLPRQQLRATTVVLLLAHGGPADIARLIVAVVVNAIDGMQGGRTRSDVFQKARERLQPIGANANASAAVIGIAWIVGIATTIFHADPRQVLRSAAQAVCQVGCQQSLQLAPARTWLTTLERGVLRLEFPPAVTATARIAATVSGGHWTENSQCANATADRQVDLRASHAPDLTPRPGGVS